MKVNKNYNKSYFLQRDHIAPSMARSIEIFMRANNLHKALDIGCGSGQMIKFLRSNGFDVRGIDIAKEAINLANKLNKKVVAKIGSATKVPHKDKVFDLVISISVIEHLTKKEVRLFLKEARRVLKPGGYIFLVTPNYATPIRLLQGASWFGYNDPTHINFFTPWSLASKLNKYGFYKQKLFFKTDYNVSFDWEFPFPIKKFPKFLRILIIYLLFSTPVGLIRNSFWIAAQKSHD